MHWWPYAEALDPQWALEKFNSPEPPMQAIWINHHDGLHSRWTTEHLRAFQSRGVKVLVTYHDTRETLAECPKLLNLASANVADHIIIHEPVEGLGGENVTYLRQGVLPAQQPRALYQTRNLIPVLGTAGFDFPWKNYDRLAELTAEIGWGMLLLCNNITEERAKHLQRINPLLSIHDGFRPAEEMVSMLAGCTATAFMYECANTGTSGAIRLGIAARKPVFALGSCRQFRDLLLAEQGSDWHLINWVYNWDTLKRLLISSWPVDFDPAMVYLAERDAIRKVGQTYTSIIRGLC